MGKKRGRAVKRAKQALVNAEPEEVTRAPHTFVIYRGKLGKNCTQLMLDFRKLMEPFTATHLKVQKRNVVKDFVAVSGLLNVTHMVIFTKSDTAMYMRVLRLPRGPTLTFKINNYCLAKDVLSSLKKRVTYLSQFANHPLLVLNNFSGEGLHLKLMTSMFQNMFPSININKVKLNTIRRCLLMNYDSETKNIDMRHYTIKVVPSGVSKPVKKLVNSKIPDLSHMEDISEFITTGGNLSESEAEPDGPFNKVTLPQKISSRGNEKSQQSAIRLVELGPRMTLELIKIEEGLMEGDVLYHALIEKTPEEIDEMKVRKQKQKQLKVQRKKQQNQNKKEKQMAKDSQKSGNRISYANEKVEYDSDAEAQEDADWFEAETGEKPDKDLFPKLKRKRTMHDKPGKVGTKSTKQTKKVRFQDKEVDEKSSQVTKKRKGNEELRERVKPLMSAQEVLKRRKKRKEALKKKSVIAKKTRVVMKHKQTRNK